MTGGRSRPPGNRKPLYRDRIENLSRADVGHLKSEKPSQRNESEALGTVDCEGPDPADTPHRANLSNHLIGSRICHNKVIRVSRPQVDAGTIRAHHCVVWACPFTID